MAFVEEKERTVKAVFKVFEDNDIKTYLDIIKITKAISLFNNIRNIDKQSKDLVIDFIKYNILDKKE